MQFQAANSDEFQQIRDFYWNLIDAMQAQADQIGWKKGVYPTDDFLKTSLQSRTLFTLTENGKYYGCVILNHACNDGYRDIPWRFRAPEQAIFVPHALAVSPAQQGSGIGRQLVEALLHYAKAAGGKAVRLDILGTNTAAEKLYTCCGFQFVQAKNMFYEDTGWTMYKLYERSLES